MASGGWRAFADRMEWEQSRGWWGQEVSRLAAIGTDLFVTGLEPVRDLVRETGFEQRPMETSLVGDSLQGSKLANSLTHARQYELAPWRRLPFDNWRAFSFSQPPTNRVSVRWNISRQCHGTDRNGNRFGVLCELFASASDRCVSAPDSFVNCGPLSSGHGPVDEGHEIGALTTLRMLLRQYPRHAPHLHTHTHKQCGRGDIECELPVRTVLKLG